MAELREHHSRNIYWGVITENERTSANGSVIITSVGSEEDKKSDAQGVMVPQ